MCMFWWSGYPSLLLKVNTSLWSCLQYVHLDVHPRCLRLTHVQTAGGVPSAEARELQGAADGGFAPALPSHQPYAAMYTSHRS